MSSPILHAIGSLMHSNLCSMSQQLKMEKVFLHDEGKPMANQFTNDRVWEVLGHTSSWPKRFPNFSSTKDSITPLKPRTWKITQFLEKKRYFWAERKYYFFLTLKQRRPQTCLSRPLSFWNNCMTSYNVISAAFTLWVQVPIIKKKSYVSDKENNWPFVS